MTGRTDDPRRTSMFKHVDYLQFQAKPEKPDAFFAAKLQELIGGQFGEMTVMMQYLWQGWSCRVPGKYKDMIMDIGTEEISHVEMLTVMLARLLEGAPGETTEKAAAANPVLAAVLGGQNPQPAIVSGGTGRPRNGPGGPGGRTRTTRSAAAATRCRRTARACRGTPATSWPAATCSRTSGPTPPPR